MWLVCDLDKTRAGKTGQYLQKLGVNAVIATSESELPNAEERVTVAIFSDGWNIATVEKVKKTFGVNVLLCVTQNVTPEKYTELVEAGYADIIQYPPNPDYVRNWETEEAEEDVFTKLMREKKSKSRYTEVKETIKFTPRANADRKAEVISVVGVKGGVGKTTISTLIAGAYKHKGRKVVLAELDPQGNLSVLLKTDKTVTTDRFETLPNVLSDAELEQNMIQTPEGFWIIPKGERPLGLSEDGTQRLIHLISQYADVVILDCNPSKLISTMTAMVEADKVYAITTSDRSGWAELPGFLSYTQKPVSIIMNRVNERPRIALNIKKFLEKQSGYPVRGVIFTDKVLYQRVQDGLSVLGSRKTGQVINQIIGAKNGDDVISADGKGSKQKPEKKRKGLFK